MIQADVVGGQDAHGKIITKLTLDQNSSTQVLQ
jgi:hypothetical protein